MIIILISLVSFVQATLLSIKQPSVATLYGNKTMPVNVGDFGYVPYGSTIQGRLVYTNNTCNPLEIVKDFDSNKMIIISERGNCSFLYKAQNTQKAGGIMLVLIDNTDENLDEVLMIADGSAQVYIPTVLIKKKDGEWLKQLMKEYDKVLISIFFELQQQSIVDLEYYFQSTHRQSYLFLNQFYPYFKKFGKQITFSPIFVEYFDTQAKARNFSVTNSLCISGGRYCAFDPDGNGPLMGRDVIFEDLRQLCIINQTDVTMWFDYAMAFENNCLTNTSRKNFSQSLEVSNLTVCSIQSMKQLSIDQTKVMSCFYNSFDCKDPLLCDSRILAKQRELYGHLKFNYWPVLTINGIMFRGDLYIQNVTEGQLFKIEQFAVLEAICDGFVEEARPTMCESSIFVKIDEENRVIQQNDSVGVALLWITIVLLLVFFFALSFVLYKRQVKKELRNDLKGQVDLACSQYYQLSEAQVKQA